MAIVNKTFNIEHFQLKHKNKDQWDANYILAAGEIGLELDTRKYKLGDGVKKWSELDYYSDPVLSELVNTLSSDMTQVKSDISSLQSSVSSLGDRIAAIEGITTISVNAEPQAGE